jgi:hypothetical protein
MTANHSIDAEGEEGGEEDEVEEEEEGEEVESLVVPQRVGGSL